MQQHNTESNDEANKLFEAEKQEQSLPNEAISSDTAKEITEEQATTLENSSVVENAEEELISISEVQESHTAEPVETNDEMRENNKKIAAEHFESVTIDDTTLSISRQEEDADQDSHELEDEALEEKIAYSELSRTELLAHIQNIFQEAEPEKTKQKVREIRDAYEQSRKEHLEELKSKFQETAEEGEEFRYEQDITDHDFYASLERFREKLRDFRKQKEAEQSKNLKLKLEIIESLKVLLDKNQNITQAFEEFKTIQEQWRNIGQVPQSYADELYKTYHHYIDRFFGHINMYKELRELDFKRNQELKTGLCEKAEDLILEPSIKLSLDSYKILQEEWRNIGQVAKEVNEVIWERFKAAGDKLFERRKEYLESQAEKFQEAFDKKTEICKKAETFIEGMSLNSHIQWQEASAEFAAFMEEWKKAGFANKADNDKLWEQFKAIRNRFFEAKEIFYKDLRQAQTNNLKIKNDICLEAESLRESTEWKKTAERLKKLQEDWKKVGNTSKKHSDKLWSRFRAACDSFFENRKRFFENSDAEHQSNLEKKEALIEKINAFETSENYSENLEKLKEFQSEWIEIGHVPIKKKDAVQQAYRKAIDAQFNKLRSGNEEQRRQVFKAQLDNFSKNKDGKTKLSGQRNILMDKLKRIQADVQLWENNIGFFSSSKNADALIKEFKVKIEKGKREIGQIKEQLDMIKNLHND
jgi:hypothetical protein